MIVRITVAIAAAVALSGCEESTSPQYTIDRALQREIFKECLTALPAGPVSTKYNDWDEVVEACYHSAGYMARRCYENCPPAATVKSGGDHG